MPGIRGLSFEDQSSVRAATLPSHIAIQEWQTLMSVIDFQDINSNTQRLAPMIYVNLKQERDLSERERLKGAYKHCWSKNQRLLFSLVPLIHDFLAQGINYRLAKGLAIQMSSGLVGARVVGDADIVVSEKDVAQVREILERHGFRCNTISPCGLHPVGRVNDALDFNQGDNHIDIHVAERKSPHKLLKKMLTERALLVEHAGVRFAVPTPELLLLHSAFHGWSESSPTDLIQSLADVAMLSHKSDLTTLVQLARDTSVEHAVHKISEAVESINLPYIIPSTRISGLRRKSRPILFTARSRFSKAWTLVRKRFRGARSSWAILTKFEGRRAAYFLWHLFGQLAVVERRIIGSGGGFLNPPSQSCASGFSAVPFASPQPGQITGNTVAIESFDYRFAIRVPSGTNSLRITFESMLLDTVDVGVYQNGVQVTRLVSGSKNRDVTIRHPLPLQELSIRPEHGACNQCFAKLSDMRIHLALT